MHGRSATDTVPSGSVCKGPTQRAPRQDRPLGDRALPSAPSEGRDGGARGCGGVPLDTRRSKPC